MGVRRRLAGLLAGVGAVVALVLIGAAALAVLGTRPAAAVTRGDDGPIVFTSGRDGNTEIYAMQPDGSGQRDLSNDPASDFNPDWSPEGSQVVFESSRSGEHALYVVGADGNPASLRRLTYGGYDATAAWSPDGSRIAFVSIRDLDNDGGTDWCVCVINADGDPGSLHAVARQLSFSPPAWSPDGSRLAFTSPFGFGSFPQLTPVMEVSADAVDADPYAAAVYLFGREDRSPVWSPDGTQLAFVTALSPEKRSVPFSIAVAPRDSRCCLAGTGFDSVDLSAGALASSPRGFSDAPSWSPDGGRLAYHTTSDDVNDLWLVAPDGTGATHIDVGVKDPLLPVWAPSGRELLFTVPDGSLHAVGADGGGLRGLTDPARPAFEPSPQWLALRPPPAATLRGWSPCGAWSIFGLCLAGVPDGDTTTEFTFTADYAAPNPDPAAKVDAVEWDFDGDSTPDVQAAVLAGSDRGTVTATHTYSAPGSYRPRVRFRGVDGRTGGWDEWDARRGCLGPCVLDVSPAPVVARLFAQPAAVDVPEPVRIPTSAVPTDRLDDEVAADAVTAAPVGEVDFGAPLQSPSGDVTPLADPELGMALPAFPEEARVDAAERTLSGAPLAAVPLAAKGGWESVLGPELGGVPLQHVTVEDVLTRAPPGTLQAVKLADLSTTATPLRRIAIASALLGDLPLRSIPLDIDAPVDAPESVDPWCDALDALDDPRFTCEALGVDQDSDTTLFALDLAGVPLRRIPLRRIPLRRIDLEATGLGAIPLRRIDLEAARLAAIPLRRIDLEAARLAAIPLRRIDLEAAHLAGVPLRRIDLEAAHLAGVPLRRIDLAVTPLRRITVGELPDADVVVDCALVDCRPGSTVTLEQAAAAGAIRDTATLADLGAYGDTTLADLIAGLGDYEPAITLADLIAGLGETEPTITLADLIAGLGETEPPLTLGGLLPGLIDSSSYPWDDVDLDGLDLPSHAQGSEISYCARLNAAQDEPRGAHVSVTLPEGFAYVAGSARFGQVACNPEYVGPDPVVPLPDPRIDGRDLAWDTPALEAGYDLDIAFKARPGAALGTFTSSLQVTASGGTDEVRDTAPVEVRDTNPTDDPVQAPILDTSEAAFFVSHLTHAGDRNFVQVLVPRPGAVVSISLRNLSGADPADYDLAVYAPADTTFGAGPEGPNVLTTPPLPDAGIDLDTADDVLAGQPLDDVPLERRPLRGLSAGRGPTDEGLSFVAGEQAGQYLVQVSGHDGMFDTQRPYVLQVRVLWPLSDPPSCTPPVREFEGRGEPGTLPADLADLPDDAETLVLVNQERLGDTYGPARADTVMEALDRLAARPDVRGIVVPIEAKPYVRDMYNRAWSSSCSAIDANLVAETIFQLRNEILEANPGLTQSLRSVVVVGGDDIVPFARVPDLTVLSNQREYASTFLGGSLPWESSATGQLLTDDLYGDLDPARFLDRALFLPDLGVGRLVETPEEIVAAVDRFTALDGQVSPQTALVTGYDFLTDGAQGIRDALTGWLGNVVGVLLGDDWTRADLSAALFPLGGTAPDVASVNAHYDHYRLLPADQDKAKTTDDLFTTADIAAAGPDSLLGRIVYTMGCNAGLPVPDSVEFPEEPPAGEPDPRRLDWPQAYARAGAAAYVANTGFGYGDSERVAYSERVMDRFTTRLGRQVRTGGGVRAPTVGEALIFAKQDYFAELGAPGVYDKKAIEGVALYGLPMYRVQADAPPEPAPEQLPLRRDRATGLDAAAFDVRPDFGSGPVDSGDGRGGWFAVDGGTQVTHWRPIEPRTTLDVTQAGRRAHGALLTGLASHDVDGFDPVFARPVIDVAADSPESSFGQVTFPSRLQNVTTFDAPDGRRQQLVLVPGQFIAYPGHDEPGRGTQRLYDRVGGIVLYSDSDDFVAPTLASVRTDAGRSGAGFAVEAADTAADGGPGEVRRVVALARGGAGPWQRIELRRQGSGTWTGALPGTGAVEWFVQAVDSAGNVGITSNVGEPAPALRLVAHGLAGGADWWRSAVSVRAEAAGGGPAPDGVEFRVDGGAWQPYRGRAILVTGDGAHTVEARVAAGAATPLDVRIDATSPAVTITQPASGTVYGQGEQLAADYACSDAGSGPATCTGPVPAGAPVDTATPGRHRFAVEARDVAGNTERAEVTYVVRAPDAVAVRVTDTRTGAAVSTNSGSVTSGGYDVVPARSGPLRSVTGTGTLPGVAGGTATVTVDVHRTGVLPFATGTVAVIDPASGVEVRASATFMWRTGPGRAAGIAFATLPGPPGTRLHVAWTVTDRG